jgi:hypothetical protein
MRWFSSPASPGPVLRTRLRLESLDARALPSSLTGFDRGDSPLVLAESFAAASRLPPAKTAPQILDFMGVAVSEGWYTFTGRVVSDTSPAGLTVTFGGIPSLIGQSVTTATDGTFSLYIQLQTNGSDDGTATAQTTANGLLSNLAVYDVSPSA